MGVDRRERPFDGADLLNGRCAHPRFGFAIERDDTPPFVGQMGAAPFGAAVMGRDKRSRKELVQFVDEQPGASVRHRVDSPRGGDRSRFLDRFKQRDLAGAEPAAVVEIEPNGQPGQMSLPSVRHAALRGQEWANSQ